MRGLDRPLVRFCARRCGRSSVGASPKDFMAYIRTHIIFDNLLLYAVLLC